MSAVPKSFPFKFMSPRRFIARSCTAAINHLLAREPWARQQLTAFAGRRARLVAAPFELMIVVQADGLLRAVPDTGKAAAAVDGADGVNPSSAATGGTADAVPLPADVTIAVTSDVVSAFWSGGLPAAARCARIEGDADFAALLARLAEQLRWDAEEDLSRIVGDAAAHRLARTATSVAASARRAGSGMVESVVDYLSYENPSLVKRASLDALAREISTTRDDLARLEKRIERLLAGRQTSATRKPS
ncbi:MAG: ubiquinone biosynthesis accessory factor UbiJ [Janthinobacterium lividum]